MYVATKFDDYVMNPQPRVDLAAPSSALAFVARFRGAGAGSGFGGVLCPASTPCTDWNTSPDPTRCSIPPARATGGRGRPGDLGLAYLASRRISPARPIYDLLNSASASVPEIHEGVPGLNAVGTSDLDVYESPTAWPRAFFTDRVSRYKTPQEFARMVVARRPSLCRCAGQ